MHHWHCFHNMTLCVIFNIYISVSETMSPFSHVHQQVMCNPSLYFYCNYLLFVQRDRVLDKLPRNFFGWWTKIINSCSCCLCTWQIAVKYSAKRHRMKLNLKVYLFSSQNIVNNTNITTYSHVLIQHLKTLSKDRIFY